MVQTSNSGDLPLPNIGDIQGTLWEQVQALRAGQTTPANANAVSNAVGKIFTSVKLQIEYARLTGQTPSIPMMLVADKAA